MKPYRLVVVDWVDSSSTGRTWRGINEFGPEASKPLQCRTVGYLMATSKLAITLAMNLAYEPGCAPHSAGNDMNIPVCSILRVKTITQRLP
jgi:hypothetical protein